MRGDPWRDDLIRSDRDGLAFAAQSSNCRNHAGGQGIEIVAALERCPDRHAERSRQLMHMACHRLEGVALEHAVTERIVAVRVAASRDQDQLWTVLMADRH